MSPLVHFVRTADASAPTDAVAVTDAPKNTILLFFLLILAVFVAVPVILFFVNRSVRRRKSVNGASRENDAELGTADPHKTFEVDYSQHTPVKASSVMKRDAACVAKVVTDGCRESPTKTVELSEPALVEAVSCLKSDVNFDVDVVHAATPRAPVTGASEKRAVDCQSSKEKCYHTLAENPKNSVAPKTPIIVEACSRFSLEAEYDIADMRSEETEDMDLSDSRHWQLRVLGDPANQEQGVITEPTPIPKSLYGLGHNDTFILEAPPYLSPTAPYEYAQSPSAIVEEDETSNSDSDTTPSAEAEDAWQPPLPPVQRFRHGQILVAIEEEDESESYSDK